MFETAAAGRGLTLAPLSKKKQQQQQPPTASPESSSSATASATAIIAQPDPAWFETLRATARRAWSGGVGDGDGNDLEAPPRLVPEAGGFGGGNGGGGWVPVGARAAGTGRAEVDGEGALVPAFDARIAARMAQELFSEMAAGKEAGR